jgi:ATP-binding cassette subfamily B multidrug efflux pump
VNTYLSEHLSGMKVVQMFGREEASQKEFSEANNTLRDSYLKERSIVAVFRPLTDFLSSVAIGILIYAGGLPPEPGTHEHRDPDRLHQPGGESFSAP